MWRDEQGAALVLVLMCATLFLVLGGALATVGSTETAISAAFREGTIAVAAADAAVARMIPDLAAAPDLNAILAGHSVSTFVDGGISTPRTLPDGTMFDLAAATNFQRCGEAACTDAQVDAVTAERPWGVNNPRWQPYASGWVRDVTASAADAPNVYVVVWVGDDPLETDGDPSTDDAEVLAPGHDTVMLRVAAYAANSVRRRIEVVVRRDAGTIRVTGWREIR